MFKTIPTLLLASLFLAACNGEENLTEEPEEGNTDPEQQEVYQIGDTAVTESSSYGFPYEVTVNNFKLTTEPIDGYVLDDFYSETSEPGEDSRFALVNITLVNTGNDGFVLNDTMSPVIMGEMTSEFPEIQLMSAFDEEVPAGEELTEDLIFVTDTLFEEDGVVDLLFNVHDPNVEVQFELPIPE